MQKKKTTINAFGKSVDISGVEPLATAIDGVKSAVPLAFVAASNVGVRKDIKGLAKRSDKKGYDASQVAYDQRKDQAMMAKSKGPIREGPRSRMKKINPRKEYSE